MDRDDRFYSQIPEYFDAELREIWDYLSSLVPPHNAKPMYLMSFQILVLQYRDMKLGCLPEDSKKHLIRELYNFGIFPVEQELCR